MTLTEKHIHALSISKIKKMFFNLGDDILISILINKVESNLRTPWSWNTICTMDWAFTKSL